MKIPGAKDFWSGVLFLAFAGVALFEARTYSFGSAGRMGPGYFPVLLGSVLGALGLVLLLRSVFTRRDSVERLRMVPLAVVTLAVVLFGLMIDKLGLAVSLAAITALSALASRESRPLETAALVAVVAGLSVGIFIYALRLPLSVWPNV
jgi:hypothetical protein